MFHNTYRSKMPFKMPANLQNEQKRSLTDVATPQQQQQHLAKKARLPPADSDLVALESAPRKPQARRLPATAPLNICVYKALEEKLSPQPLRIRQAYLYVCLGMRLGATFPHFGGCSTSTPNHATKDTVNKTT